MTRSRDLANLADGVEFLAADHTKLDGIEAAATADQTNAEIRTAVEAASDSNVFTDADHSKLNAIEASATADQTNAEIRAAVEAATDSNVFTDADHSKLNAVEASADVTDTANVTAAGALMDSELTNLAAVKAINQSLVTTASPTFAGLGVNGTVTADGLTVDSGTYHKLITTFPSTYLTNLQIGQQGSISNAANTDTITFAHSGSEAASEFLFTVNNSTKLTITGTGNVGIGNSIPSSFAIGNLVVGSGSGTEGITIYSGNDSEGIIRFADGASGAEQYQGQIKFNHAENYMRFYTSTAERLRIDTSGNLGIATTENVSSTSSEQGLWYQADGWLAVSRASNTVAYFNRLANNGDIVQFRKNGTTVGSIGVADGDNLIISSTASAHGGLKFNNTAMAAYVDGASSDGTMSIGTSAVRFKDLYLSDGVYLGGTGAANKLSDYEEGTWTPIYIPSGGSFGTTAYVATDNQGSYTKIGRNVFFRGTVRLSQYSIGSASGNVLISGFPFTVNNNVTNESGYNGVLVHAAVDGTFTTNYPSAGQTLPNTVLCTLVYRGSSNGPSLALPVAALKSTSFIKISGFYQVS